MTLSRILVIDDSVVVRRTLTDLLGSFDDITVDRVAPNGEIGLAKIQEDRPDLVVLDVEMPGMSGLETLERIRTLDRDLPVIMFSTLTQTGAKTTIEALTRGASDYLAKPTALNPKDRNSGMQELGERLANKIRALHKRPGQSPGQDAGSTGTATPQAPRAPVSPVEVIVVGISTGGPNALSQLVPALPADLNAPVLVVQHMPPAFTKQLADRLDRSSALHVQEARAGVVAQPGQVWIAPGDFHLEAHRHPEGCELRLQQGEPENSCRPAADVLFRSAAEQFGRHALGLVMTGMGKDGLKGCQSIRDNNGHIIVQDEASSVVWGMPGHVAQAGLADAILPLSAIADCLVQMTSSPADGSKAGV